MDKRFEASWSGTFVVSETEVVDLDFFDERSGYDDADLKRIERLSVDQSAKYESGDHIVKRIS